MNERISKLRQESLETAPRISHERAELETDFYIQHEGKYSVPVMRGLHFKHQCQRKTIYIGEGELIVGERGPSPKSVPTFPELTCHSLEDLSILNSRRLNPYLVARETFAVYRDKVIPYWQNRSMRERLLRCASDEWKGCYEAGMFTEFMEQRAPGHTTLDGAIYREGMLDFKSDIAASLTKLDYLNDPQAADKAEELEGMDHSCDAIMIFAERHADLAEAMAGQEADESRRNELLKIAEVCRRVPARPPRNFREALQMYWFVHLGTITELNGWDAMSPGRLDQHLEPFYRQGLQDGSLTRDLAKELLSCLWIKFNNHPAPPKVGITAEESGTYNDFTNINIGGLKRDGSDGVNEVSYLVLEVVDELHLLQPGSNVQLSRRSSDHFLKAACRVIRKGYGYPSVFNADLIIAEQLRMGKSLEDAREGGASGCIETGCFGKEAYILTGYLNVPKVLELALHGGTDPASGRLLGPRTGDPREFRNFDELYEAFTRQLQYVVDLKIRMNNCIERIFARHAPATFLSVVIHDCIQKGRDYSDGGPRYNANYIQCVGIGTVTDSLSAIKKHVYEERTVSMERLIEALARDFRDDEPLRLMLANRTPAFGNDDDYADSVMQRVFTSLFEAIDGQPNTKGTAYHLDLLSTTCHVYFGSKLGATANGRLAGMPLSDGTSPSQGADRRGPTAVIKSLSKMDQFKSGGTLLNQKFLPGVLTGEEGLDKMAALVRTYFRLDGHHIQFNVVDTETLRDAQEHPERHRDLLVRVAGYSDYFVDLDSHLQEEIIARTSQQSC
jgi:trans-4-hydroxy-L-proline dehydratase